MSEGFKNETGTKGTSGSELRPYQIVARAYVEGSQSYAIVMDLLPRELTGEPWVIECDNIVKVEGMYARVRMKGTVEVAESPRQLDEWKMEEELGSDYEPTDEETD